MCTKGFAKYSLRESGLSLFSKISQVFRVKQDINLVDDTGSSAKFLVGQEVGDSVAFGQAETLGGLESRNLIRNNLNYNDVLNTIIEAN